MSHHKESDRKQVTGDQGGEDLCQGLRLGLLLLTVIPGTLAVGSQAVSNIREFSSTPSGRLRDGIEVFSAERDRDLREQADCRAKLAASRNAAEPALSTPEGVAAVRALGRECESIAASIASDDHEIAKLRASLAIETARGEGR